MQSPFSPRSYYERRELIFHCYRGSDCLWLIQTAKKLAKQEAVRPHLWKCRQRLFVGTLFVVEANSEGFGLFNLCTF